MNPIHERIKFKLRTQGSSLADIARSLQVTKSSVTRVSLGLNTSARIRQAIADRLGESVEELWPESSNTV